jgi:hypothetical protein
MKIFIILMTLIYSFSNLVNAAPLPKPWYQTNLEQFEAGITKPENNEINHYGYLKSTITRASRGAVLQNISPPEGWLGLRVRFTGNIKTDIKRGNANLFMSITHGYGYRTYDYMLNRKLFGKLDWQEYSIVLDIPQEPKASIIFGVNLKGEGIIYFDDFEFEIVDYDVDVTGTTEEIKKRGIPQNLNFEQRKIH